MNGITSLKTCEIFGGTSSGMRIVTLFAARKAESNPFVPKKPVARPSLETVSVTTSLIGSAANINKPTIAANSVDM